MFKIDLTGLAHHLVQGKLVGILLFHAHLSYKKSALPRLVGSIDMGTCHTRGRHRDDDKGVGHVCVRHPIQDHQAFVTFLFGASE